MTSRRSDTKTRLDVRPTWTIQLTNADEDAGPIALVPVSAMVVIIIVLVVTMLPVIKAIPIVVSLMSTPIICP